MFTLPNLLSLSRVILTPVFVLMMVQQKPWAAFFVFLAAGRTPCLCG
jgi:phosphatidylglycerophosphate synthase